MDPAAQQFIQTQTELLQNLSNIVVNMQAQVNNPPQQQAHLNKHREFMSHHPQYLPMQLIHLRLRIG
jgi:transcription initiation factor TFIID subunit TAF12